MMKNDQRELIIDELTKLGLKLMGEGYGGRHPFVEGQMPDGQLIKFTYSATGSAKRLENIRLGVRKRVRELQARVAKRRKGE